MSSEKEHQLLRQVQSHPSNNQSHSSLPDTRYQKFLLSFKNFCEKQLSPGSKVTAWASKLYNEAKVGKSLNQLLPDKQPDPQRLYFNILIAVLAVIFIFSINVLPDTLKEIDQLKNDLSEQAKIIEIEEKNKAFLDRLEKNNNALQEKMNMVDEAVPKGDERAENIISSLEVMAFQNQVAINSIGISRLSDSQFYYDDLVGVVEPFEYSFSVKSSLFNVLSFIQSLRNSLRMMDVMAMEISQDQETGEYQASFSVLAYHLIQYN